MKLKYLSMLCLGTALTGLTACNDYLDVVPESSITPETFFTAESDLAAYSINLYSFTCITNGTYGISVFGNDNATDNQAATGYSSRWVPGEWKVGSSVTTSDWYFNDIRHCNYFFDQVLPKYEAGIITGTEANIRHYIGEMYVIRAYNYFNMLQNIGDCPIVTTALEDVEETLVEASKRRPRNQVARFILEDLDTAVSYLSESAVPSRWP